MRSIRVVAFLASLALLLAATSTPSLAGTRNSGYYDHKVVEYEATIVTAESSQAAQLLSKGNIVYHIVDSTGNAPAVQCAANTAAFPSDATACNVLNFIPTEVGYSGGAWNLQIFTWRTGVTPVALTKDDDILAARDAGLGTLTITNILVRCPVVNFANLR